MKATDNGGGGDFEQPEPDSYAATCYKVVDLGTQQDEYQGKTNNRRQVVIGWELEHLMSDGRPFVVSEFFTLSLNEKAKLRKTLESWRSIPFTEAQLKDGFDLKVLLGAPCLLNVTRTEKGKTKVGAVMKLPKSMTKPEKVNAPVYFDLDTFNQATFDGLSEWYQKKISQSPEYQKLFSAHGQAAGGEKHGAPGARPESDDIPF